MFANRYTAFVDACCLAGALKRNLLLTLAEAEFFRVRWSNTVLDEMERAIAGILTKRGDPDAITRARKVRNSMTAAFEDSTVDDFEALLAVGNALPDPDDAHVLAPALKTQAAVIVTDNLKDFPEAILRPLNLDVRSTDSFLADTISLDYGRAIPAIRRMRERFRTPALTPDALLLKMDAAALPETVDILKHHAESL